MQPALAHPPHASFTGRVGVARADITPPAGIYCRNWGAAAHDVARGIHRPLCLTAVAIAGSTADAPLVLVDADLGWWASAAHEREFRRGILDALRLPPERFLFAVTHTHAAPPLSRPEPHWAGGDLLAAYHDAVQQAAIRAAREAIAGLEPATIEWHTGACRLAANRDLAEARTRPGGGQAGATRVVCGYDPAGPADDTLLVGRVTAASGRPLATIVNYACHPTTLAWENDLVSPDYVGAMRETIEAATAGAPAVFLQGASGELAPRYQYVGDPAVADAHGRELGHAVLATLHAMEPPGERLVFDRVVESGAPLAVWRRERRAAQPSATTIGARRAIVELPLKQWPTAAELVAEIAACPDRALAERLRRRLRIREALGDGATYPFEVWGWRLGEAIVVGTMAEAYSRAQQSVRTAFPDHAVVWLNLVNGGVGYLPPRQLYDVDIYPAWQTPFDRGSLELVEQAAVDLGRELL